MNSTSIRKDASDVRLKVKETRLKCNVTADELQEQVRELDQIIDRLKATLAHSEQGSETYRDVAAEIADCLGVKGGTLRDLKRYADAAQVYDDGAHWEKIAADNGGRPNSYALLQRLVNRILAVPSALSQDEPVLGIALNAALYDVREQITQQIKSGGRGKDPWAHADVALVEELLEHTDKAEQAWLELEALHAPKNVYKSAYDALVPLFTALTPHVSEERAAAHGELLELLRHKSKDSLP